MSSYICKASRKEHNFYIIIRIFRVKSWKRRWFILNDNCLYYFEFTTDKEPRGIIPLENIRVREVAERSKPHCFELFAAGNEVIKACKTDSDGKVVEGKLCTEYLIQRRSTSWFQTCIYLSRQTHCLPDVRIYGGRKRRVDKMHSAKHKSQSILRHAGRTQEKSTKEFSLKRRVSLNDSVILEGTDEYLHVTENFAL